MMTAHQCMSWQWDMRPVPIRLTSGDVCSKIITAKPFKHRQLLYSLMSMGRSCPSLERPSADLCKLVTMQQHLTRHASSVSQTPLAEPTNFYPTRAFVIRPEHACESVEKILLQTLHITYQPVQVAEGDSIPLGLENMP